MMHIFDNLKTSEDYKRERQKAIELAAKRKGMTIDEYLEYWKKVEEERERKWQEDYQRRHKEELKRLGITEEQYQKRIKRQKRKEKIKEAFVKIGEWLLIISVVFLVIIFIASKDAKEVIEPILFVGAAIWLLYLLVFITTPIWYMIWKSLEENTPNKIIRILSFVVIIAVLLCIICLVFHTCGGSDYEPRIKMRPDKF